MSYQKILKYFSLSNSKFLNFILTEPKQRKWIKIRHFSMGHIQIWHHVFLYQEILKYFNDFLKLNFLSFMTKVNPSNGNESKSDIFPWDIFKSDSMSFLSKNIKVFQWLFKIEFSQFYDQSEPKQRKWIKIRHLPMGHIQIWLHVFFIKKY